MLHRKRFWSVLPAESPEWLAETLTCATWCGCNGFSFGGYLFVNDAACADGAQEYGVLLGRDDHFVQIESVTFSWMTPQEALVLIRRVLAGEFDNERYSTVEAHRIETPEEHGRCHLCM